MLCMFNRLSCGIAIFGTIAAGVAQSSNAALLVDGSFETQAVLQGNPYYAQPDGSKWGAAWNNWGWSSWQANFAGAWVGGGIARTEEYATGWKWARTGDVLGIIKDRQTMSQTFTATEDATGTLSWFDANRSSWRENTWYGRQNNYSVTLTDSLGNVQTIGNYTSEVYLGLDSNSWINAGDDRFSLAGKQGWFARTGASFILQAGMTYTLSFNSLSPYIYDENGNLTGVDDRTTLLDDIAINTTPIPAPGVAAVLGLGALAARRRRR
jgi:uncharacterized protein (TIGR03382 family)